MTMPTLFAYPDTVKGTVDAARTAVPTAAGLAKLSIAIIDPDLQRRKALCGAIQNGSTAAVSAQTGYLSDPEVAQFLADNSFEAALVAIDSNPDQALRMVENLCNLGSPTVMVYSRHGASDLMMRAMWAGAREFILDPISLSEIEAALSRVAARAGAAPPAKRKAAGECFVFLGAKGGSGVTTLATNFAVALARDSAQSTVLIDLDLPKGDAALNLGIVSRHSTLDALRDPGGLNVAFLSSLLVQHDSGLSVLSAPSQFQKIKIDNAAVDKLLAVAAQAFDSVVIDAGARTDWTGTRLFPDASIIYLVTQVGIPELRNANRVITENVSAHGGRLQVVLNRYAPRMFGIDDEAIERALTVPAHWRIESDFLNLRRMQLKCAPVVLEDSPIARIIGRMAHTARGLPAIRPKRKMLGLFS
jgi:pilus assembly protein CpaE